MNTIDTLIKAALEGDKFSISRLISLIEREDESASRILEKIYPHSGNSFYLGITGPPGSGKSTLVNKLVQHFRRNNFSVAVIAVDPSSPFSGGALLGDRVRMDKKISGSKCFFRSMSAGRVVGGLAQRTKEASWVLDASGKEIIIIETVGVGQSELDIMTAADSIVVTLTPESGDGIQIMKAGILEIADIFVVNKADRPGAEENQFTLERMLDLKEQVKSAAPWRPPIVCTSAVRGDGVSELYESIILHYNFLKESEILQQRRELQYKSELIHKIHQEVDEILKENDIDENFFLELARTMKKRNKLPHTVAKMLARQIFQKSSMCYRDKQSLIDDLLSTMEDEKEGSSLSRL